MPKISVIIPTYNRANYLPQAINSVLNQSAKDVDIMVIDDGSTDNTKDIIRPYLKSIKYIRQDNAGAASARNTGIENAKGEWIAFLDSDDFWEFSHLEKLIEKQQRNPKAALIYSGKRWVDHRGSPIKNPPIQNDFPEGWIFRDLYMHNYISSCSCVFVKRSVLLSLGGFSSIPVFRISEDYDLWLRIAAYSFISAVPKFSVNYRRHESNLMHNIVPAIAGHIAALNSASMLIKEGRVHKNNRPETINITERMKKVYKEASISLFYSENYNALRRIGIEAIGKGYGSFDLMLRWLLSFLSPVLINKIKKRYRSMKLVKSIVF
jgi:glycosyltransferase involved in cell wall biosynthesis